MILVTGGAGFLGSNVAAELEERGMEVAVCDRLGSGEKWKNLRNRANIADMVSPENLRAWFARRILDGVIHMAACAITTEKNADIFLQDFEMSMHLLQWCSNYKTPLVYASSAATYGDGSEGFDDPGTLPGLKRLRPLAPYAWSKHAFDLAVAWRRERGDPMPPKCVGLKLFNCYGPNEHHKGEMRSFALRAYQEGTRSADWPLKIFHGAFARDFVYAPDAAAVAVWALLDCKEEFGIWNVGTGAATRFEDVIAAVVKITGRSIFTERIDIPDSLRAQYQIYTEARTERLRAAGWTRLFRTVEEGVGEYVSRYLSRGEHR